MGQELLGEETTLGWAMGEHRDQCSETPGNYFRNSPFSVVLLNPARCHCPLAEVSRGHISAGGVDMPIAQEQNSWGFLLGWGRRREESWRGATSPSHQPPAQQVHPASCLHHQPTYQQTRSSYYYENGFSQPPIDVRGVREPPLRVPHPTLGNRHNGASRSERKRSKTTSQMLTLINDRDRQVGMSSVAHQTGILPSNVILSPILL